MPDSLFISALVALAGVIGVLWKVNQGNTGKIEKRADRIEGKYDETLTEMVRVTQEVGELKGKIDLAESLHPKLENIENITSRVLDIVTKNE